MRVRTVTLEILRHGPPHNQLISPLTQYLALSGRYQAVTLQLPWEHSRLEREIKVLRYGASRTVAPDLSKTTASDRADIAAQVSRIFEAVPGLIAGLAPDGNGRDTLTHLRLIFSAAELALVPFEISLSPRGFPCEGEALSTQPVTPLLMTREIRGAPGHRRAWPRKPRVLFAWAAPPNQAEVPWRAHLQALVSALRPWTGRLIPGLGDKPTLALKRYLTMLPQASLAEIAQACAAGAYTHIHILAHGGELPNTDHKRFAVVLRGTSGEDDTDRVSGERLAAALTGRLDAPDHDNACFSCPAVVSMATCDSGNQADVVVPGASAIHTLHASGIPLVVGSLFPLSNLGSITLTEKLYQNLLRGEDPRVALHLTRQALRTGDVDTHDWASMVTYASFSDHIDDEVLSARYKASSTAIRIVNDQIEELVRCHATSDHWPICGPTIKATVEDLETWAQLVPVERGYEIEGNGLLGSKDKRKAQAFFIIAKGSKEDPARKQEYLTKSLAALLSARASYERAARARPDPRFPWKCPAPPWVLTQALSLDVVLGQPISPVQWRTALAAAQIDLAGPPKDVAWVHGSLAELYLLRGFASDKKSDVFPPWDRARQSALKSVEEVVKGGQLDAFIPISTRRQIDRYITWWSDEDWQGELRAAGRIPQDHWVRVNELAQEMLALLPLAPNSQQGTRRGQVT